MKQKPNKTYSQNFLTSESVAYKIVESAELSKSDYVLEIGPGTGFLTQKLLESGVRVLAIEKDKDLIESLKKKFKKEVDNDQIKIIEGDFLDFDLNKMPDKYKTVANIPYYITGQILKKLLSADKQPEKIVVLTQKEVGKRITDTKKQSILSLSVLAYGQPSLVKTVKAGSFYPKPKVDSAILKIDNINKEFFKDITEQKFFTTINKGFSQKRKFLKSNLEIEEVVLEKCGIKKTARADNLSIKDWGCLTKNI